MRLPDFLRTTTVRWALVVSGTYALALMLSFAFVYVRTTMVMTGRVDIAITEESDEIAAQTGAQRQEAITERMLEDPRRVKPVGLFDASGRRIAGNVEALPSNGKPGEPIQNVSITRVDAFGREHQTVRAAIRRLADGDILVVAWYVDYNREVSIHLWDGLTYSLVPTLLLGVLMGVFISVRAQKRVALVSAQAQRIIAGELKERLPTDGTDQPYDKLASIVNGMLDAIEALIYDLAGVADDIAHDLRTPLTRVRISLERGRANADSLEGLQAVADQAIDNIDHALSIITALLRIREIEHVRRLEAFDEVEFGAVVRDAGEFYRPIAEEKGVTLTTVIGPELMVRGDRDLLSEAIANLVDNAVKFTPAGGHVEVSIDASVDEGVVRIRDTGPGIDDTERDLVMRRFYRSDQSRHSAGVGLGLSLVSAIVKLHGFRFEIGPGPGFTAEIHCAKSTFAVGKKVVRA